eukprot:4579730-Pyramimonas_sp.AAC.1
MADALPPPPPPPPPLPPPPAPMPSGAPFFEANRHSLSTCAYHHCDMGPESDFALSLMTASHGRSATKEEVYVELSTWASTRRRTRSQRSDRISSSAWDIIPQCSGNAAL